MITLSKAPCLKSLFPGVAPDALDLLQHLVRLNPADRITAQSALEHPYFSSHPAPATQHQLAALLSRTPLQQQEQLQKRPPLQRKPLARTPRRLSGCPAAYELPVSTTGGSQLHQLEHHLGHQDHYHQQGHHRLAGLHQDHQQQLYHPLDSLQLHQQQIDTPGSIHPVSGKQETLPRG
ncbi:cyclin-dependent kinase D-1 [Haematococcus lacustris]|uniref:Cyclin-dependent kinase D-1 n=1 Tax=Haematococcus lacustris TaxID=44745 RepID=A0A699ZZD6_HAELA|nr:cyclin-dependent kinase D-1 [Haematococcus lacustris]